MAIRNIIAKTRNYIPRLRRLDNVAGEAISNILDALQILDGEGEPGKKWKRRTAADFLASDYATDVGAWTVTAPPGGSLIFQNWREIADDALVFNISIIDSTIPGAAANYLTIRLPHHTIVADYNTKIHLTVGGVFEVGNFRGFIGDTFVRVYKQNFAAFPAGPVIINVLGHITLPAIRRSNISNLND